MTSVLILATGILIGLCISVTDSSPRYRGGWQPKAPPISGGNGRRL